MSSSTGPNTPGPSAHQSHLQRGRACITCRRKKMKCDGARPYCGQCGITRRPEDCEYTDKQGRTQTEVLEERISQLKLRIRELQAPPQGPLPVFLHNPYTTSTAGGFGYAGGGAPLPPLGIGFPGGVHSRGDTPAHPTNTHAGIMQQPASTSPLHVLPSLSQNVELLEENYTFMLEIFLPHASRLGFSLYVDNFVSSVAFAHGDPRRPHVGLLDVIALWGQRLVQGPDFVMNEPRYIDRALASMALAIGSESATHRVQLVQAEVLMALYFLCDGRLLEGRYHTSAAMSAALSYRLHQIGGEEQHGIAGGPVAHSGIWLGGSGFEMAQPSSAIELGERINVFWSAYLLDRCWSVALGSMPSLLDENPPISIITTPLPRRMEDYITMGLSDVTNRRQVLGDYLSGAANYSSVGAQASVHLSLVVAGGLFEKATRLLGNTSINAPADPGFLRSIADVENVVHKFTSSLEKGLQQGPGGAASGANLSATVAEQRLFAVTRTLGQVSIIQLHSMLAESDGVTPSVKRRSYDLCLKAARNVLAILGEIEPDDVEFLNPIIGVAWLSTSRILLRELNKLQAASGGRATRDIEKVVGEVEQISTAMKILGRSFPLIAYQASSLTDN